jgi:hypothetical protein
MTFESFNPPIICRDHRRTVFQLSLPVCEGRFESRPFGTPESQTWSFTSRPDAEGIGGADSGFRTGIDLMSLYDFLDSNHPVIIGGNFGADF